MEQYIGREPFNTKKCTIGYAPLKQELEFVDWVAQQCSNYTYSFTGAGSDLNLIKPPELISEANIEAIIESMGTLTYYERFNSAVIGEQIKNGFLRLHNAPKS